LSRRLDFVCSESRQPSIPLDFNIKTIPDPPEESLSQNIIGPMNIPPSK